MIRNSVPVCKDCDTLLPDMRDSDSSVLEGVSIVL